MWATIKKARKSAIIGIFKGRFPDRFCNCTNAESSVRIVKFYLLGGGFDPVWAYHLVYRFNNGDRRGVRVQNEWLL